MSYLCLAGWGQDRYGKFHTFNSFSFLRASLNWSVICIRSFYFKNVNSLRSDNEPIQSVSNNPPIKIQHNILSLRWKYFHTNISSSLNDLYTETRSTDAILVSDDQFQSGHENYLLNIPHFHSLAD